MSDPMTREILRRIAALEAAARTPGAEKTSGAGPAFPASPTTGALWYRTDLNWLCVYDGARWVTCHEYVWTTFGNAADVPHTFTADSGFALLAPIRADYQPYFSRAAIDIFVATTHNGSNYWTITANSHTTTFGGGTAIKQFNTSATAVNTWGRYEYAAGSLDNAVPSDYGSLAYAIAKTGAPGTLYLLGSIYYRLIIS